MDIISNNPRFKALTLLIWSTALVFLHITFTLLSVYNAYISGDIMRESMSSALAVILPIIALLIIYIRFGVLVSAYHSYQKGTLPFTCAAVVSFILTRVCELIIYKATYTTMPEDILSYILSAVTSFLIDLAIVILLLLFSRGAKERKRKALRLILIACAFPLAIGFAEEIWYMVLSLMDIKAEYGSMALTATDVFAALLYFVRPVMNAAIGFAIMFITHKILKAFSKS